LPERNGKSGNTGLSLSKPHPPMLIYKQYDQAALDRQYNNRLHVPDFATYLERWDFLSRLTEQKYYVVKDIEYGKLSLERLDIYPSRLSQSKTLIFIHGGYWQKLDKSSFQFIAEAFRAYDITPVLLNYPLAPAVSIDQIVASCRQAIHWVHKNIFEYNGNPDQLFIAGHSAGAHLTAMLMATTWNHFNLKTNIIKGACAISGLFNLIPIRLSDINHVLNLDTETAFRNSPVLLQPENLCPLLLAVGADETNEFLDQSRELHTRWKENISVELLQIPGLNHYSILETMLDSKSCLHQAMRRLMKI
jgi:arylformamidase